MAEKFVDVKYNSLIYTSAHINVHIRTAAHGWTCLSDTPGQTTLRLEVLKDDKLKE